MDIKIIKYETILLSIFNINTTRSLSAVFCLLESSGHKSWCSPYPHASLNVLGAVFFAGAEEVCRGMEVQLVVLYTFASYTKASVGPFVDEVDFVIFVDAEALSTRWNVWRDLQIDAFQKRVSILLHLPQLLLGNRHLWDLVPMRQGIWQEWGLAQVVIPAKPGFVLARIFAAWGLDPVNSVVTRWVGCLVEVPFLLHRNGGGSERDLDYFVVFAIWIEAGAKVVGLWGDGTILIIDIREWHVCHWYHVPIALGQLNGFLEWSFTNFGVKSWWIFPLH